MGTPDFIAYGAEWMDTDDESWTGDGASDHVVDETLRQEGGQR